MMKNIHILFFVFLLVSCIPKGNETVIVQEENLLILKEDETLQIEQESKYGNIEFTFFADNKSSSRELFKKQTNMNYPFLHQVNKKVYFVVNNELDRSASASRELWLYDGEAGIFDSTGISVLSSVTFSKDNRFICYSFPDTKYEISYPGAMLYVPIIRIYDLNRDQIVGEYDLLESLFKKMESSEASISYDSSKNGFFIGFHQDGPTNNMGEIFISLATFEYEILKESKYSK